MTGGGKRQASIFDFSPKNPDRPTSASPEFGPDPSTGDSVSCPLCCASLASLLLRQRTQHVENCLSTHAIRQGSVAVFPAKEEPEEKAVGARASEARKRVGARTEARPKKLKLGPAQIEKIRYVNKQLRAKRRLEIISAGLQENEDGGTNPGTPQITPDVVEIKDEDHGEPADMAEPTAEPQKADDPQLLVSTRKNDIPSLKLLPFRLSQSHTHTISVDAFCYKPHELVDKYFLSHFHSDHYGGLTKKWCRERTLDSKIIYCSEITARLLAIRFDVEPMFVFSMKTDTRYLVHSLEETFSGGRESDGCSPGIYVTLIDANHCPGAVIFLYEAISDKKESTFYLHCGDFRVSKEMMLHPLLRRFMISGDLQLERVYLDTTYMSPQYNFPKQEQVCDSIAEMVDQMVNNCSFTKLCFGSSLQARITDIASWGKAPQPKKYLIVVGTYLIGKEKIAVSISKRMGNAPIYVSNISSRGDKGHIVKSYHDEYLDSVLTEDPTSLENHSVMIHLVPMKIAGTVEELSKYYNYNEYYNHFQRCVGLRPTGWSFKGGSDSNTECLLAALGGKDDAEEKVEVKGEAGESGDFETTPDTAPETRSAVLAATEAILKQSPAYSYENILEENAPKSTKKLDQSIYRVFSLPYSEHSSFRELSYFVVFFNIGKVIPTVNTGNPWSARKMEKIISWWQALRRNITDEPGAGRQLSVDDF